MGRFCLSSLLWFHPLVPRVRTLACLSGVSLERDVPEEQIRECIHTADNVTWVDVEDPGEREIAMLLEEFGFHPLALEEAQKGHQRPKIAEYKGHILVVTYGVPSVDGTSELQASEVDIFIGRNYAVTIHRNPSPALDEAYRRWTRGGAMLREGVGFLVFTIVDSVIDTYFPVLAALEEELDDTELSIFNQPHKDSVQDLLANQATARHDSAGILAAARDLQHLVAARSPDTHPEHDDLFSARLRQHSEDSRCGRYSARSRVELARCTHDGGIQSLEPHHEDFDAHDRRRRHRWSGVRRLGHEFQSNTIRRGALGISRRSSAAPLP